MPISKRFTSTGSFAALAIAAFGMLSADIARAEEAKPQTGPIQLDKLKVEGESRNSQTHDTGLGRLPGTVQDIPQTINVVPQEIIRQRNVTTLDDALRNVAGITAGVGEGGGSFNGDQFQIRGFTAKDDVYVDGLRDFGVYTRDAFNVQEVQILKGPSSELFGRGTTGGGINTISKKATRDRFIAATGSIGTDDYYRGTVDINMPISSTAAIRLNGMVHFQDVADRDLVTADRYGFAPSIALGLGTDTTFDLTWLHQKDDRRPDYGVPVLTPTGQAIGGPVTENAGVPRGTFYGFTRDYDRSTVDMVTAKLFHKASDWLSLYNDTRVQFQNRKYAATRVSCAAGACLTNLYDGNPATNTPFTVGAAASATGPYEMQAWGVQDIGTAVAEFQTFGLKNRATAGFDISYLRNDRSFYTFGPARPSRDPFAPDHDAVYSIVPWTAPGVSPAATATTVLESLAQGTDYAVFVSEQLWLTPEWSIAAGVRWDSYRVTYNTVAFSAVNNASAVSSSEFFSPKASLIFQPSAAQTYYFSWAQGQTPQGTSVTNQPTPVSTTTSAGGFNTRDLEPEESENLEIGAKIGLFDNRLGINAALFQVTKSNTKETDGLGTIISSGDKQRVRGVEISVTGEVIERLAVTANYAYLQSETLDSTTAAAIGRTIANAPHNAATLWAVYEPIEHLSIGFGPTYRDKVYLNNTNLAVAPYNLSFDAVVAYEFEHVRLQLNGANLTDRLNYSATQSARVVPASGRTVVFTVALSF